VAVIGATVARELFAGQSPVGRTMRANRVPIQVVGVLASKGQNAVGFDQDDTIMVPLKTAQSRLVGGNRRSVTGEVNQIVIKAVSASAMPAAERQVDQFLRAKFRLGPDEPPTYSLRNISQLVALRTQTTRVMTSLLAGIAAVSLLVGGIGIMNIMLVSVTERTREIGLRMAVGARPGDVRLQFLTEAALLSLIGGAVGVLLAIPGTAAAASAFELPAPLDLQIVVIALGFSAVVGLLFGWVPARRASKLDPIEALRHD
jgi:putative ABC transport system permease protein